MRSESCCSRTPPRPTPRGRPGGRDRTPSPGDPSALESAQARYDDQWCAVLRVAGADEDLAAALRAAPGLPAFVEDCERWGSEGRMVGLEAALAVALTERSFDGVRDPGAVLRYRIAEHLDERPAAVPGRRGALPTTARGGGAGHGATDRRIPGRRLSRRGTTASLTTVHHLEVGRRAQQLMFSPLIRLATLETETSDCERDVDCRR